MNGKEGVPSGSRDPGKKETEELLLPSQERPSSSFDAEEFLFSEETDKTQGEARDGERRGDGNEVRRWVQSGPRSGSLVSLRSQGTLLSGPGASSGRVRRHMSASVPNGLDPSGSTTDVSASASASASGLQRPASSTEEAGRGTSEGGVLFERGTPGGRGPFFSGGAGQPDSGTESTENVPNFMDFTPTTRGAKSFAESLSQMFSISRFPSFQFASGRSQSGEGSSSKSDNGKDSKNPHAKKPKGKGKAPKSRWSATGAFFSPSVFSSFTGVTGGGAGTGGRRGSKSRPTSGRRRRASEQDAGGAVREGARGVASSGRRGKEKEKTSRGKSDPKQGGGGKRRSRQGSAATGTGRSSVLPSASASAAASPLLNPVGPSDPQAASSGRLLGRERGRGRGSASSSFHIREGGGEREREERELASASSSTNLNRAVWGNGYGPLQRPFSPEEFLSGEAGPIGQGDPGQGGGGTPGVSSHDVVGTTGASSHSARRQIPPILLSPQSASSVHELAGLMDEGDSRSAEQSERRRRREGPSSSSGELREPTRPFLSSPNAVALNRPSSRLSVERGSEGPSASEGFGGLLGGPSAAASFLSSPPATENVLARPRDRDGGLGPQGREGDGKKEKGVSGQGTEGEGDRGGGRGASSSTPEPRVPDTGGPTARPPSANSTFDTRPQTQRQVDAPIAVPVQPVLSVTVEEENPVQSETADNESLLPPHQTRTPPPGRHRGRDVDRPPTPHVNYPEVGDSLAPPRGQGGRVSKAEPPSPTLLLSPATLGAIRKPEGGGVETAGDPSSSSSSSAASVAPSANTRSARLFQSSSSSSVSSASEWILLDLDAVAAAAAEKLAKWNAGEDEKEGDDGGTPVCGLTRLYLSFLGRLASLVSWPAARLVTLQAHQAHVHSLPPAPAEGAPVPLPAPVPVQAAGGSSTEGVDPLQEIASRD
uniref:Uncharacterized protein n=1 Tax=Chromera velia CCMP2878 TaxID=1169474 RepID=A0A0G4HQY6_9ALVE|eukprot:Cvel_30364.t1-p1 / transcript=Cvel_30364.t1 / gene=Cvel_30364 / organism=Chromera_velia_CCMP2878 / gene_product=hypothetical protein / transcript_product=hypothetical protein / location=Cvel_scaffold4317:5374-9505(-) / protein_length=939 / sequence_SO=supercontig / SO=protein_coding / is_pseudo=false